MTPDLYLVDTSALNRAHLTAVREVLQPLAIRSLLATCSIVDLEVLYSARGPGDYERVHELRRTNYLLLPIDQVVCDRAVDVQRLLAERSEHRGASLPDLVIAACAELSGATVLHYDSDYDLIAAVTSQPVRWIAPRGTLP